MSKAEQQHVGAANRSIGKHDTVSIHPSNLPENQAISNKDRIEREVRYKQSIAHLPLRKQRKLLAKAGLNAPEAAEHKPQQALSRRTRRKLARGSTEGQPNPAGDHLRHQRGTVQNPEADTCPTRTGTCPNGGPDGHDAHRPPQGSPEEGDQSGR